jgi:hypothetical protein
LSPIRLLALAAALGAAAPAAAAPKSAPPAPARPPAPAAAPDAPARAAPAPAPAAPREAPPRAASLGGRAARFGASVGAVSAFDGAAGMGFHLDYGIPRTPAGWRKLDLEWHLVASFALPSGETPLTASVATPSGLGQVQVHAGSEDVSAMVFEVVPTARVLWAVTRGVAFFADAGVGLCQTVESYERAELFRGRSEWREYVTGVVLHAGVGLAADVTPRWRLVFQPVAFDLQLGPKFSAFTPTLGVAYRL